MALCTVQNVKDALGISGSSQDSLITFFVNGANTAIKRYCRSNLEQATYTDYLDGTGLNSILLRETPVQSITNIWLDQAGYYGQGSGFASSSLLTAGVDYALMPDFQKDSSHHDWSGSGMVRRLGLGTASYFVVSNSTIAGGAKFAVWPVGVGNIKVTYVAGYATIPDDLTFAATSLATWCYNSRTQPGYVVANEALGAYSYGLLAGAGKGMPPEIGTLRQVLASYRRTRI